ncbi:unnamed protein product [Albugo candida]|uniref:Phosphatase 2A Regulatory Subunit A helical domain-containing protein n=1 Tax=Albugo candida TaxID=65357 RepID=A0A024FW81_9STRA|nr:unnamed protein product [Albugo candida]|eukprot:CCI11172.1 unnamed protein product [Albugo candida]
MYPLPIDPNESVRVTFAKCLPRLVSTARRLLELTHAIKINSSTAISNYASQNSSLHGSSSYNHTGRFILRKVEIPASTASCVLINRDNDSIFIVSRRGNSVLYKSIVRLSFRGKQFLSLLF